MQTCNNYDTEWKSVLTHESGKGVFNGDIGVVVEVFRDTMIYVRFDDGKIVKYDSSNIDELSLAYCVSVHKSQGSEFKALILVLGYYNPKLLTRNLIYTAVTRGKNMVVIIGKERTLAAGIHNNYTSARYTLLSYFLQGLNQ